MKRFAGDFTTILASVLLAGSLGMAWFSGAWTSAGAWPAGSGAAAAALALAATAAAALLRKWQSDRRDLERRLEAICHLDPRHLHDDAAHGQLPPLPAHSPWQRLVQTVRAALAEHCRRVQELDQQRTVVEIRARRAMTESERIRAILARIPDPVLAVNEFDELVLANPAAERLLDLHLDGVGHRALAGLVRCEKLVDALLGACHRKTAGGQTEEIEMADGQGQPQWYRVETARLAAGGDEGAAESPRGAVAVLRDIGGYKAIQKRNAEFVSAVSHEMKTPLSGIKAYVELLADGDAEDEQTREEFLEVINSQADRLRRLVDNMLNLARIEAGVVQVHKQGRALNEILEESLHVVQPAAEAKNISLVAELSPLYLGVLADRDMLLQAAINLLSNAVKYTPQGGRVALRSRLADDEAAFEVEDTGVGLSPDDCRRVFEKFYRVEKDKTMASGTGLGLSLAKHIVEDVHGGRLTVESTLGVGSRFVVHLPRWTQG